MSPYFNYGYAKHCNVLDCFMAKVVLLHIMIGYWHHYVVLLSIRPCVCISALWLSWSVFRAKSCTSVFQAGTFLFIPSDTSIVRPICVVQPQNSPGKKRLEENVNVSFLRQTTTPALWSVACYVLLFTEIVRRLEFGCVHKLLPGTRKNRIAY